MGVAPSKGVAMTTLALLLMAALPADLTESATSAIRDDQVVVVVVGAPGTNDYAAQFTQWAGAWEQACSQSNATYIGIGLDAAGESSDKAHLEAVLAEQSQETVAAFWLVLIGHGTFDGRTAKFNLRGPDISADDLASWLKPIASPLAVINTASSSAPFLRALSAQGRIVITATKSGFEQNYARFGQFLAEAIVLAEADLDKDGQTSLLEAFLTASHRTGAFYTAAGRLATEHALLDDNGDAMGTPADWFRGIRPVKAARDGAELDGYRAHQFCLRHSETEARIAPTLRTRRDLLELEVMKLRDAQAAIPEATYFARLETLLLEIARIYETIDGPNRQP
jgi:hypothetical protein